MGRPSISRPLQPGRNTQAEAVIARMVEHGLIRPFMLDRQYYEITPAGRELARRYDKAVQS